MSQMASTNYTEHLQRVSRSFAFCIARLEEPLREWVGLTYLLCRLVDTVEDSVWTSEAAQLESYDRFVACVETPPTEEEIKAWVSAFPSVTDGEQKLLADAGALFYDFHQLPSVVQKPLAVMLKIMAHGMKSFSERKVDGVLRLLSLDDVNRYCYFVAGVIGEVLAQLISILDKSFVVNPETVDRAHRFGLFLQKVNLLKDEPEDRPLGRYLVPDSEAVLESARLDQIGALDFLKTIPLEQKGFRLFCAWSLSLGLSTLRVIRTGRSKDLRKVDRASTEALVGEIEQRIGDPESLELYIQKLSRAAFV